MGQNKKEKYSFFEALNILHQQDVESGAKTTGNVGQCTQLVDVSKYQLNGCTVTMGAPLSVMAGIETGEEIPVLLIINKKAYEDLQYPKPEPYEPQVLIDHTVEDLGDRDARIRMGVHVDHVKGFVKASKNKALADSILKALNADSPDYFLRRLKVVRSADRELSIDVYFSDFAEHAFIIEF